MVDAKDRVLGEGATQRGVERLGGGEVAAEGLFDHQPRALGKPGLVQPLDHGGEHRGRDGEVEERVCGGAERRLETGETARVAVIAGDVAQPVSEPGEHRIIDGAQMGLDPVAGAGGEFLGGPIVQSDADDRALEGAARLHPVERGKDHLVGEIAGGAEDHQRV